MRRGIPSASLGAIIAGAVGVAVALVSPSFASVAMLVAAITFVVAVLIGTRTAAIEPRVAITATAMAGCFAAAGIGRGPNAHPYASQVVSAALGLVGAGLLIVSLHRVVRVRHGKAADGVFGDALIVGLGSWIVAWVTLIRPRMEVRDTGATLDVITSFNLPAVAIAVFLAALLVFTDGTRRSSMWLIAVAVAAPVAGDVVHALVGAGRLGRGALPATPALYIAGFALAAAAFFHRSIDSLLSTQPAPRSRRVLGRLMITTSSLAVPLVALALSEPNGASDKVMRSVSALILAGAVTLRVIQSIHATDRAQHELLRSVQTDALTGLPNRALLLEQISSCVNEKWRSDRVPTIYFVDLDRFKNINDSLGHASGDEVIRTVAERLVGVSPPEAMVARLSGDEFVVLDPTTPSPAAAHELGERLLSVFREPLALTQGDVFVTASIGVASITMLGVRAEEMLRHADTAMYRAKDAGRNCLAFYDASMHERVSHRLAVETALYRALDRRELRLFHQPILDLATGDVVGFEALMRWQQGDGTIVSPAEFIPIAEDTGTIISIGSWALLEALSQLRRWIDDGICSAEATMSVNVSPRQLADPAFPSIVSEALLRAGVEPRLLWLEITESVMISEPELALATLERMKALGVRVALDDFGTGYSSLSLLQKFPLQRIKIDRAFVQGVADNPSDRSLVRTIVAMGQSLGLDMVAEGVESIRQMQVLCDLGCTKAQGYLISHPVPADAMRSTVAALERLGNFPLLRGPLRAGQA